MSERKKALVTGASSGIGEELARCFAKGGFDLGFITLSDGKDEWELGYVNEYMTLEKAGRRLATFPDLMTAFDEKGEPTTSASLREGQTVYLVTVPKEKLLVGDGNRYPEIIKPIEEALGRPMVKHLAGYLRP